MHTYFEVLLLLEVLVLVITIPIKNVDVIITENKKIIANRLKRQKFENTEITGGPRKMKLTHLDISLLLLYI